MADSYLTDLMKRTVACDMEAMASVAGFYSTRIFPYQQENFPYMVNRLGAKTLTADVPEDEFRYTRAIAKRLVIGHHTEGFKGQLTDKVTEWLVLIEDYYRDNTELTSAAFPIEPTYLHPLGSSLGADTGLVVFANNGIGVIQVGVEFTLLVPILESNS